MPVINDDTLFIHVPRTAGTQLEDVCIREYDWRILHEDILAGFLKTDSNSFMLQHATYTEIKKHNLFDLGKIRKSFVVVRNPYDRCASLYYYWGGGKIFQNFNNFISFLERSRLEDYSHNGTQHDVVSIANEIGRLPYEYSTYHFIPQYMYVNYKDDQLRVDFVIKYEDFKGLYKTIGFIKSLLFRLNFDNTRLIETRKKYLALYQGDSLERVYQLYKKDFQLFGYSKEYSEIDPLNKYSLGNISTTFYHHIRPVLSKLKSYLSE